MVVGRNLLAAFRISVKSLKQHRMAFGYVPQLDLNLTYYSCETTDGKSASKKERTRTDISRMSGSSAAKMAAIPEVAIDDKGTYKYILLKLWAPDHKDEEDFKYLVRGDNEAEWHDDIYQEVYARVSPLGLEVECVGGGRILHEPQNKKIFVYGYSQGYGKAKHSVTCDLLKKKYTHYDDISWSDDGY